MNSGEIAHKADWKSAEGIPRKGIGNNAQKLPEDTQKLPENTLKTP